MFEEIEDDDRQIGSFPAQISKPLVRIISTKRKRKKFDQLTATAISSI